MPDKILFAPNTFSKYDENETLPARFGRLVDQMELEDVVRDKWTAVKMHLGRRIGYSTVHPLFVKILVDKLKGYGAKVFITDQIVGDSGSRGYTEDYLGVPIVAAEGVVSKYFYTQKVDFKTLQHIDVAGHIHDAEVMIDFSHAKGHGSCGFGGACKNIAMGCVTDRTRQEIHNLEGGIAWEESLCTHCEQCIQACARGANKFNDEGQYKIFFHHCTYCQHCVKVCPTQALTVTGQNYRDFQKGMALCTEKVLSTFAPGHVFYINFLMNITALCDCWGFTTPAIVPDLGILAGQDIVAIEKASLDMIRTEDLLLAGVPAQHILGTEGHLFQRLHGKDPFIQLEELANLGLGSQDYSLVTVE